MWTSHKLTVSQAITFQQSILPGVVSTLVAIIKSTIIDHAVFKIRITFLFDIGGCYVDNIWIDSQ